MMVEKREEIKMDNKSIWNEKFKKAGKGTDGAHGG